MVSVSVITPTTGDDRVIRAAESVARQTHADIHHFIVFDGADRMDAAPDVARDLAKLPRATVTLAPVATGHDRYLGHRIYGAWGFLAPGDAVAYLDQDNWYEPEHVSSLAAIIEDGKRWAYALRRIIDTTGAFVCNDDCQSLGRWPMYRHPDEHLVDTNCYILRRGLACRFAPLWNFPSLKNKRSSDHAICMALLKHVPEFDTSGRYTVNYTAGSNPGSVTPDYFLAGNAVMAERYPDGFPWRKE
jgi:hypothetical protein